MTKKQIKEEFARWIDSGKPKVWTRSVDTEWYTTDFPAWRDNFSYIIEDKHATLRKLQIDKPDTEFEYYNSVSYEWITTKDPVWNIDTEYRVKPKKWYEDQEMIDKPVWVWDDDPKCQVLDMFKEYKNNNNFPFKCVDGNWEHAKPVTWRDLYQGDSDDITK